MRHKKCAIKSALYRLTELLIRYIKNNNNEDTFEDKKNFFKEKLLARGYSEAELDKASSSVSFEDRQTYIQEKPKTTEVPLVFKTKYNPHYAGKHLKKALHKHWNIIAKNRKLRMIFPKPPIIAYSRSENLRDSLVKAKLPHREEHDLTYDDLEKDEDDPPVSPTLRALLELETESRGFNMSIQFEDIESDSTDSQQPTSQI